ncbi:reverse transcriptase domain-containing protein, partial [Tanacetum coccineum]
EAEYEALIAGLRIAEQIGVKNLQANVDSRLVANQILVEELKEKSINEAKVLAVVEEEGDTWMTPIYNYLTKETLLEEKEKARVVRRKSGRYDVLNGYACQNKICGSKGHTDRILLAGNACRCKKIDKSMSRLPGSPPCAKKSAAKIDSHHANGLVERANRSLGEGIKARLDERSKDWIKELPHVLWAHRTMIKSSNGDMSFSLMYGTEAVIPAEIGMPTMRTAEVHMV